jgi:hypothetical protein
MPILFTIRFREEDGPCANHYWHRNQADLHSDGTVSLKVWQPLHGGVECEQASETYPDYESFFAEWSGVADLPTQPQVGTDMADGWASLDLT